MNAKWIMKWGLIFTSFLLLAACFAVWRQKTPEAWTPGKPLNKDDVKICVIYLDTAATGYAKAHDTGVLEMQRALGLRDEQILRKFNIIDTDAMMVESAMSGAIAEGANIIIATSWEYMDVCEKLAAKHPNVVFAHASGYKSNDTNFTNYFGRIYQARYLSGIAAGLKTQTGKVGYVAAQDKSNSEVTGGLNAFSIGVESVNPDAEVYVSVTHSWYHPAGERQAALKLIDAGCDVIAQHCDTSEPQIAAEQAGVWGIGYNIDVSLEAPNAVLTSVVWNWGVYYTYLVGGVIDGSFSTEPYFRGLAEGMVDITPLNGALALPEMETAVAEARERILSGNFNVFDGVMPANDGRRIGSENGTLSDAEITGGIDWYYHTVTEIK
jgi:basic membrane protein A